MQHISVYSSPLFGDCFVLLRKWMCNRITEMNTDQGVGYCKNVGKVETCFKYCFSPMIKWFSPLAKAVYFALWAILIPDVMSGQDFSFLEVKNMMWTKLSQEVFSCVIIGKPWVYRSLHPSSFFLIFKEWFSCSPGCSKQKSCSPWANSSWFHHGDNFSWDVTLLLTLVGSLDILRTDLCVLSRYHSTRYSSVL